MAVIYMVHPTHGAKVAVSEHEAIYDEKHGWERYGPTTPAPAAVDAPVNEMAEPRRRGRPRTKQEE